LERDRREVDRRREDKSLREAMVRASEEDGDR